MATSTPQAQPTTQAPLKPQCHDAYAHTHAQHAQAQHQQRKPHRRPNPTTRDSIEVLTAQPTARPRAPPDAGTAPTDSTAPDSCCTAAYNNTNPGTHTANDRSYRFLQRARAARYARNMHAHAVKQLLSPVGTLLAYARVMSAHTAVQLRGAEARVDRDGGRVGRSGRAESIVIEGEKKTKWPVGRRKEAVGYEVADEKKSKVADSVAVLGADLVALRLEFDVDEEVPAAVLINTPDFSPLDGSGDGDVAKRCAEEVAPKPNEALNIAADYVTKPRFEISIEVVDSATVASVKAKDYTVASHG